MKKLLILFVIMATTLFSQSWNDPVQTEISFSSASKVDLVTNRDGNHNNTLVRHFTQIYKPDSLTSVKSDDEFIPNTTHLFQNYPNPFNPETHIDFVLMERSNVRLTVYNLLGQEVKKLVIEEMIPGYYSRIFDGNDSPSGIYFFELVTDKVRITKKMMLIK